MSKIFEVERLKTKEDKLNKIQELLLDLKDALVDVVGEYEDSGDDETADTLTEALDALEDACDIIDEA